MSIVVSEEPNFQEWDASLRPFSASPFITAAWLEALRTASRIPRYFRFAVADKTVGCIAGLALEPPHAMLRKIDHRLFFFSGPAVLPGDEHLISDCLQSLISYATTKGYTGVEVKSWDYPYSYDVAALPFKDTRTEYLLDLRGEFAEIQRKMRRRIRELVKQAERNGLEFHESHAPASIGELIALLDETKAIRRAKGYEDYAYFYMPYVDQEVLAQVFQNKLARIFYARKQAQSVCINLVVRYHRRACALLVGTNSVGYELKAPPFIWFHTIRTLKAEGVELFNIGGVANDAGASNLIFFKTSFGAEKQTCSGGVSSFLQGPGYNLLHQVYERKLSVETIKQALGR